MTAIALALATVTVTSPARAQDDTGVEVDYVVDGLVTGGVFALAYLLKLLPSDVHNKWNRELLGPLDLSVRENFLPAAGRVSDVTLVLSIVAPYVLTVSDGFDEAAGQRALIYTQALGATVLPTALIKYLVDRPRPYTYSTHPRARALVVEDGDDSHKSFYSGHAATAFAAAVASSTLFATQNENREARAAAWGIQLALATATANLRVRAGKHFYSDVLVGALVGSGIGFGVVALHAPSGEVFKPTGVDIAAMGTGIAVGALVSELLPLTEPNLHESTGTSVSVLPIAVDGGGGISVFGVL